MTRWGRWISMASLAAAWACAPSEPPGIVRKAIGPEGGLITSHDGVLTIVLQPGALSRTFDVEIFPSDEPPVIFGPAYRVRPNLELEVDAEVTYRRVFPNDPSGVAVAAIRKSDYEAEMGHWSALPSLDVDLQAEHIVASDFELSLYYGMLEDGRGTADDSGGMDGGPGGPESSTGSDPDTGSSTSGGDSGSGTTTGAAESSTTSAEDTGPSGCGDGDAIAGEVCFAPAVTLAVGAGPSDVVVGDFDGDGNLDVATANGGATTVTIRLGDGAGGLGNAEAVVVGAGPRGITAADFDDDGDDDLVVAVFGDDAIVGIASNAGTFVAQPPTIVNDGPLDLSPALLDGDALPDLVVLSQNAAALSTFVSVAGNLGPTGVVPLDGLAEPPVSVVTSVFNGLLEPVPDTDAFAFGGGSYQGYDGTGGGTLSGSLTADAGTDLGRAWGGAIGGSAQADIAVVDRARGEVLVLLGDGMAMFAVQPALAVGAQPSDVVVADVTHDGDPDILVSNAGDDTVTVLERTGGMAWDHAATLDVGGSPSAIAVGDFDGDGALDIVVACEADDSLTLLVSDP
jgi:hypothetical protein